MVWSVQIPVIRPTRFLRNSSAEIIRFKPNSKNSLFGYPNGCGLPLASAPVVGAVKPAAAALGTATVLIYTSGAATFGFNAVSFFRSIARNIGDTISR